MSARDTATLTEHDSSVNATANAPQIVQIESLGKMGLMVILVMFLTIVALAFFTGRTDGLGEARAEELSRQFRLLNTRVEVVQHEFNKVQAALIAKGIIDENRPEDE